MVLIETAARCLEHARKVITGYTKKKRGTHLHWLVALTNI